MAREYAAHIYEAIEEALNAEELKFSGDPEEGVFSFGFKLVLNKFPATMPLQFLTQLAIVGFTFGAVVCALSWEDWWTRVSAPWLRKAIAAFAAVSLEMYLVQFPIISLGKALPFPVNVAVVVPLTILTAFLLNAADTLIARRLIALIPQKKG